MNWDLLSKKAIDPPIKPVVKSELDTSNFSDEFTRMLPIDSPAIIPKNAEEIFQVLVQSKLCVMASLAG